MCGHGRAAQRLRGGEGALGVNEAGCGHQRLDGGLQCRQHRRVVEQRGVESGEGDGALRGIARVVVGHVENALGGVEVGDGLRIAGCGVVEVAARAGIGDEGDGEQCGQAEHNNASGDGGGDDQGSALHASTLAFTARSSRLGP